MEAIPKNDAPITVSVLRDHGLIDASHVRNMKRFEIGDTSVRFLAFACEGPECWRIELWANKTKVCENPTVGRLKALLAALSTL